MKKGIKAGKFNWLLIIILVLLTLYTVSLLFPIFWSAMTSFKDPVKDYYLPSHKIDFPKAWSLMNYKTAWIYSYVPVYRDNQPTLYFNIVQQFGNSLLYSIGCAAAATFVPCLVSYIVARYRYKFLEFIYAIVIVTMALPVVGSLPSEIQVSKALGIFDTFWGLWIMKANFLGVYFLVFYAQFKMIPKDYTEAAKIDGASNFRVMVQVIMPLAVSTISTVFLLTFIAYWNDYQIPMIYLPSHPVAAYGIYMFYNNKANQIQNTPTQLAGMWLTALPIIVVFLIFQDKLVVNMSIGGLKG